MAVAVRDAIKRDDVVTLAKYLNDGGCVESGKPNSDWSLLHFAASSGSIKCISVLLDWGANINAVNIYGLTPLQLAAWCGHIEALTLLLNQGGANINETDDNGRTALYSAAANGHVDCVQFLLERGANRKIADAEGRKPIHLCKLIANLETREQIRQLLNGGGQATKAAKPRCPLK